MDINQVYDNQQKPTTVNQIDQVKPAIPKSIDNYLVGYIGNSMNAGHDRTIAWKQVMAGERHKQYNVALNMQLLTPLTPAYQTLKCTLRAFFVPNSRVWDNAENFISQKGGSTVSKTTQIPNIGHLTMPIERSYSEQEKETAIVNTQQWRDSWISSYIPRLYNPHETNSTYSQREMPAMSILPIRGRVAIYNDFLRNKEYEEEKQEYKDDTVSTAEWQSYIPTGQNFYEFSDYYTGRSRRQNSYYTDYRTELQGMDIEDPYAEGDMDNSSKSLLNWASWESKIAEARTQAENAQKNDWEIIAEIRGSKKLSEGKVQLLGERTFNLNYSSITQSSYNSSEVVKSENFQVMGTQGAYSYTNVDIPLYAGVEFIEEGYIHIIATVTADTVFETGVDRTLLNIDALSVYRPDMLQDKKDVLYEMEMGIWTNAAGGEDIRQKVAGFKRKYSELFKLPNIIAGDMTTEPLYKYKTLNNDLEEGYEGQELTHSTYQFFETSRYSQFNGLGDRHIKLIWKDYTDLLLNKNQAIENEVIRTGNDLLVTGQNQVFFVGLHSCICDLPVDDSIKKNYTVYGEH